LAHGRFVIFSSKACCNGRFDFEAHAEKRRTAYDGKWPEYGQLEGGKKTDFNGTVGLGSDQPEQGSRRGPPTMKEASETDPVWKKKFENRREGFNSEEFGR